MISSSIQTKQNTKNFVRNPFFVVIVFKIELKWMNHDFYSFFVFKLRDKGAAFSEMNATEQRKF